MASIGVGIAVGAVLAGRLSRGRANFGVMRVGGWGFVAQSRCWSRCRAPTTGTCWAFGVRSSPLIVMGTFAGMYAIPLQVFMQSRPPEGQKGRMIAVMNQANFAAILLSVGRLLAVRSHRRCTGELATAARSSP